MVTSKEEIIHHRNGAGMFFNFKKIGRSVICAFQGVWHLLVKEHNFRVGFIITLIVIIYSVAINLEPIRFAFVFGFIGLVLCAEAINSALEREVDLTAHLEQGEERKLCGSIKDISAAASVMAVIASFFGGFYIFGAGHFLLLSLITFSLGVVIYIFSLFARK